MNLLYWALSGPKNSLGPNKDKLIDCNICYERTPVKHMYAYVHSVNLTPSSVDVAPAHVMCQSCAMKLGDTCPQCRQDGRPVRLYFPF